MHNYAQTTEELKAVNCKNMEAESQRTALLYGVLFGLCDAEIHTGITPQTTMGDLHFQGFYIME